MERKPGRTSRRTAAACHLKNKIKRKIKRIIGSCLIFSRGLACVLQTILGQCLLIKRRQRYSRIEAEGTRSGKVEESHRRRALGYLAFTSTIHFAQRLFSKPPPPPLVLQALDACVRVHECACVFTLTGKARTHAPRACLSRARI